MNSPMNRSFHWYAYQSNSISTCWENRKHVDGQNFELQWKLKGLRLQLVEKTLFIVGGSVLETRQKTMWDLYKKKNYHCCLHVRRQCLTWTNARRDIWEFSDCEQAVRAWRAVEVDSTAGLRQAHLWKGEKKGRNGVWEDVGKKQHETSKFLANTCTCESS